MGLPCLLHLGGDIIRPNSLKNQEYWTAKKKSHRVRDMKIKGFLALLMLVVIVVYFLFIFKAGKQEQLPRQIEAFQSMKDKLTRTNMTTLERIITTYIAQEGKAPKSLDDLGSLYILPTARVDAWGTAIRYERISDSRFRLISPGKDRLFNTEDDIIMEY